MLAAISVVTVLGLLVQVVSVLRMVLIADAFGLSIEVDAYNLGLILPTLTALVMGSWIQTGYLGRYTALLTSGESSLAVEYRSSVLIWILLLLLPIVVTSAFFSLEIMSLLVPDSQAQASSVALQGLCLTIVPIVIADFMGMTLNGHRRFFLAASAPLANVAVSVLALNFWPTQEIQALVWSLVLGACAQLLIVCPCYFKLGFRVRGKQARVRAELITTFLVSLPIIPAVFLSNSTLALIQLHAARLGEGVVALMGYATRLNMSLGQVLVVGVGTVLLPHFAALITRGDASAIVVLFRRLTRAGVFVGVLTLTGVFLFGEDGIRILLARGEFTIDSGREVAHIWVLLSFSIFPFLLGTFVAKYFQAKRQPWKILVSGMIAFMTTWVVCSTGVQMNSVELIAAGPVVSFSSVLTFWLYSLRDLYSPRTVAADVLNSMWRALVVMGPAVAIDLSLTEFFHGTDSDVVTIGRVVLFCTLIALSAKLVNVQYWLGIPEREKMRTKVED